MASQLLQSRDPEILLRNAHRLFHRSSRYRGQVLWVFVHEVTAFGATYSTQICSELGWNPNALVRDPLPPRSAEGKTAMHEEKK